jgi:hypothetical protein
LLGRGFIESLVVIDARANTLRLGIRQAAHAKRSHKKRSTQAKLRFEGLVSACAANQDGRRQ